MEFYQTDNFCTSIVSLKKLGPKSNTKAKAEFEQSSILWGCNGRDLLSP